MAATYVPIVIGALIGVVASLMYIRRTKALSDSELPNKEDAPLASREQAVTSVLGIYLLIAWACFAIAVSLGDLGFILCTGAIALIATVGSATQWRRGHRAVETQRGKY